MKPILLAAMLAACPALGSGAFAQAPASVIRVEGAWARATAPHAPSGGIFLTLTDTGAPDQLIGATTPVAAMAQLHQTVDDHGIMKMTSVPRLDLPTGKPLALRPGGYHLMLMGLKRELKPGDRFPVTLTFAHAPPVTAMVTVGGAGASGPAPMGKMKMP